MTENNLPPIDWALEPQKAEDGTLIGRWGPMRSHTCAEIEAAQPKAIRRRATPKRPMSARQREYLLSDQHRELLRRNREKLAAEGRRPKTPTGTVQGWGGTRRKELERLREEAKRKADIIMEKLEQQGLIEPTPSSTVIGPDGTVNEAAAANVALRFGIEVVLAKETYSASDQLKAANMVLTFTKAKPEQKTNVRVSTAEDFLAQVLAAEGGTAD